MSIEARKVYSGYYVGSDVLNGVTLRAEKSKITVLIGPNGCGKSTLLKTIYGFLKPRQGKVYYEEQDITGWPPYKMLSKGVIFIPQAKSVFPYLSVYENMKITGWSFRQDKGLVDQRINRVYNFFPRLRARAKVLANLLSGGEQKMLEFSRVYMHEPKIVIVDEPTAGLAPQLASQVYEILRELSKQKLTILLVDQNIRQALSLSDYVYTMSNGIIEDEGPREKFEAKLETMVKSWI